MYCIDIYKQKTFRFHVISRAFHLQLLFVQAHTHWVLQHAWSHVSRQTIVWLTRARKKHRIFVDCDDALCNR